MNLKNRIFYLPLLCALCLFIAGCGASNENSPSAGSSSGSNVTVFREHKVTDPGMNNIVASTFLVPEGWEVKGGLSRPSPQYFSMAYLLDIAFAAPDGRQIRFLPSLSFEFGNSYNAQPFSPTSNGNMYLPLPSSPGQWVLDMAQRSPDPEVSNLRLVSENVEPDITKLLQQQNQYTYQSVQQLNAMGMQTGISSNFDTQATVVVLQYDKGGKALEESILIAWQYYVNYIQDQMSGGYWGINFMYSLSGPVGTNYLNDPQLAAIAQSNRPNPVWVNEMNKHYAAMARIRSKGAADRQRQNAAAQQKLSQTLSETNDIIAGGWAKRNAIQQTGHSSYIDSIHEVTPYTIPSGETVKLPSFYDNVYTDNNGRYILANDAFYNPNQDAAVNNQDWVRIQSQR